MTRVIRSYLVVEAAIFFIAAAVHGGVLLGGYEHREARIAETAIAAALLLGAVVSWMRPPLTRMAGIGAQGFALFWTLVGIATIAAGIGPQTVADIAYHIAVVLLLLRGLLVARRAPIHEVR